MAKLNVSTNNLKLLRTKAAKRLEHNRKNADFMTIANNDEEVDLYKLELEIQNEELLETQNKLHKTIAEYTTLFNNAPIGYIILDNTGIIKKANATAFKLLGVTAKQLHQKYFSTFIKHKSCQDRFYIYKNLAIETGKKHQFECKLVQNKQNGFDALIESIAVNNAEEQEILCTIIDITKQKEQEKALKDALTKEKLVTELKSQFISIASHEFRTPLVTILTSTELIEKYNTLNDQEKKQRHLQKISTSVARIKDILIDFLTAEQLEKGEKSNNPTSLNIVTFIKTIIDEINILYDTTNIEYLHKGKNSTVYIDEHLLKTCITNLIVNAIKYSPQSTPISITTINTNSKTFSIKINDEGIGIPKINQNQIFEKFYRGNNAGNINGTGLGLHITKNLMHLMGGNLFFTSKENKGTTFTLTFTKS